MPAVGPIELVLRHDLRQPGVNKSVAGVRTQQAPVKS
jgi:hypothetical protein